MTNIDWHFVQSSLGVSPADNLGNPLRNTKLKNYEVLVRESFQNSYDERINNEQFSFKIKKHLLNEDLKKNFFNNLHLNEILDQSKFFEDQTNYFSEGKEILSNYFANDKPIPVLEVSDYGSNGLGGRWNRSRDILDRFFNLVLSISRSRKQNAITDETYLGSYGVGKMVFALSSDIRTIIYYSKFKKSDTSGNDHTRLMATSFLPSGYDTDRDIEFSGHAYFGIDSGDKVHPKKPIINENADSFIKSLGFNKRMPNQLGTSIYIPFCNFEANEIKSSFEKWWWPALLNHPNFSIEIENENGEIFTPAPSTNSSIKPFIDLYFKKNENLYVRPEGKNVHSVSFNLSKLAKNYQDDLLKNTIALIREGLVIEYKNDTGFKTDDEDCIGVAKTEKSFQKYFAYSEPEAHDTWNAEHGRLLSVFGQYGANLVRLTLNSLYQKCRDFQMSLSKDNMKVEVNSSKFIDDMLRPLFSSQKKGIPSPITSSSRLPYIHKNSERKSHNGSYQDLIKFKIGLNEDINILEPIEYNLKISLMSVMDANNAKGEKIPIELKFKDSDETISSQTEILTSLYLSNEKTFEGEAKANIFEKWTTKWSIELTPKNINNE